MLAQQLRDLRKKKSWTQRQAAKEIGIEQSYLSKLENGLFVPSEEVIEKINRAYEPTIKACASKVQPQKNVSVISMGLVIMAIMLFLIAALELAYNNIFYTYESQFVGEQHSSIALVPKVYVTDVYRGEKFIQIFDGENWLFTLVAQRSISRIENRWGYFIAIIFLFAACYFQWRHWHHLKENCTNLK